MLSERKFNPAPTRLSFIKASCVGVRCEVDVKQKSVREIASEIGIFCGEYRMFVT